MNYVIKFILLFEMAITMSGVCACTKREVTEAEARQAALARIEKVQSDLKFDASRLPPLSGKRIPEGFLFEVRDEAQNITLVVHVTKTGLAELSSLPLNEEKRRHEAGIRAATSVRPTPSESIPNDR
jgi:hypothetical protein